MPIPEFMIDKGGRPRVHDREALAYELVEWALEEDSLNLNAFCTSRNPILTPSKVVLFANENNLFREAYEFAKAAIAVRRENKLNEGTLHVKSYDLNATVYDQFLKYERHQQAQFESKLRVDEKSGDKVDPETEAQFSKFMTLLQSLNSSESNKSTESKSE